MLQIYTTEILIAVLMSNDNAANTPMMPEVNIIRVLHIDLTSNANILYSLKIEMHSVGMRILWHAIKLTCQKCEIIKFRKTSIRRVK